MSLLFPKHIDKFKEKHFLREKRLREFMFSMGFKKRIEQFRQKLCELDDSISCIAATGHGIFFKSFVGFDNEMKNVEIILCDFDKKTGEIINFKSILAPE
jgi:hypothetical protein